MIYYYKVHKVTLDQWKQTPLGTPMMGGVVIDGIGDTQDGTEVHLLITRHHMPDRYHGA